MNADLGSAAPVWAGTVGIIHSAIHVDLDRQGSTRPANSAGLPHTDAAALDATEQGQVLFRDDFTGTKLSKTRWTLPVWRFDGDGTYLGRTQLRVAQNAKPPKVSGGVLHLRLDTYNPTARMPGDSFYGQEIISQRPFLRGDGLVLEVRARVVSPAPGGIVYAPFLYGTYRYHDEIDFELLTNEVQSGADRVQTNVYDDEPFGAGTPQFVTVPGGDLTQYHVYRTEWLPDQVRWSIDGGLIRTETAKVPEGPMALYLNTWVPAADWAQAYNGALQPAASAAANQTFYFDVDYVTVSTAGRPNDNPPDLRPTAVDSNVWQSAEPGRMVDWTVTVKNNGRGPQHGDWAVQWYLSADRKFDSDDTLIATVTYSDDLAAGASVTKTYTAPVPQYYYTVTEVFLSSNQMHVVARVVNAGADRKATNDALVGKDRDWFWWTLSDKGEPNDDPLAATVLGPLGKKWSQNTCTIDSIEDVDWYQFTTTTAGRKSARVRLDFTNREGDLALAVYDQNLTRVGQSDGTKDAEQVSLAKLPAGDYYIKVWSAHQDICWPYTLTILL